MKWINKISHEGIEQFADAFRQNMACDVNEAVGIAAALLRFHEQAITEVPETMNSMLKTTMNTYGISENDRKNQHEMFRELNEKFMEVSEKLKECTADEDTGMHNLMTEATATVSVTDVFVRVEKWTRVTCWDGTTPIPAWVLNPEIPLPCEYETIFDM